MISDQVLETAREANSSFSNLHEDIVTERQAGGIEAISPLAATARVGSVFGSPPSVMVTDEAGAPLVGAPVTFVIVGDLATFEPGAGSSVGTWTVVTGLNGVATAPPVLAGSAKGAVPIVVVTQSLTEVVSFSFAVRGVPTTIEAPSGTQMVMAGTRPVFDVTLRDADGDPVPDEPVTALLYPNELDWLTLPEGSGLLTLTTDAEGKVRFGARGDGSDTFTLAPNALTGTRFALLLLTADPQAITTSVHWQVDIGH